MINIWGGNWYDGIYIVCGNAIHNLWVKKSLFLLQIIGLQNYKTELYSIINFFQNYITSFYNL